LLAATLVASERLPENVLLFREEILRAVNKYRYAEQNFQQRKTAIFF